MDSIQISQKFLNNVNYLSENDFVNLQIMLRNMIFKNKKIIEELNKILAELQEFVF